MKATTQKQKWQAEMYRFLEETIREELERYREEDPTARRFDDLYDDLYAEQLHNQIHREGPRAIELILKGAEALNVIMAETSLGTVNDPEGVIFGLMSDAAEDLRNRRKDAAKWGGASPERQAAA